MMLAAIEVYNKPTFPQREQVFTILVVNAWEALFKAKLLKDSKNKLSVLYVKDGRKYKKNKAGRYITIDITIAMSKCGVHSVVESSLNHLIETRNAATHLTAESKFLPLLVFTLGTAALRNYAELLRQWFGVSLNQFSLLILPISFKYPFSSISTVEASKEPEEIAAILRAVHEDQETQTDRDGFFLVCELKTELISAKKLTGQPDLIASVDASASSSAIVKHVKLTDRYPYRFTEVYNKIKRTLPTFKQPQMVQIIKAHEIKGNPQYSAYNYASQMAEKKGPTNATPVIYNENFVQFCIALLQHQDSQ
jgi:hypothetical protein